MDNDNKVVSEEESKNIHNEVLLFLGDELERIHHETESKSYDLEGEYAKTKKHKTFFTTIILVCTFVFVIGIAWGLSAIISKHDEEVTVSLAEFDDLNLKGLLDTVSKTQAQYDNALKNKMNLQNDLDTAIRAADSKLDDDIFIIDSMKLRSKAVYDKKIAEVKAEYRQTIKAIHEQYDAQIAMAEKETEEYKKQLDEYNTTKIESAKEKERLLDSERQLRELQEKELTDKYEKRIADLEKSMQNLRIRNTENMKKSVSEVADKYQAEIDQLDPVIEDESANEVIAQAMEFQTDDFDAEYSLSERSLSSEKLAAKFEKYQDLYDNYAFLDSYVASIPQKNSIPSYVEASHELVNEMSEIFLNTTIDAHQENVQLSNKIEKLNKDIDDLQVKMDTALKTQKEEQKQYYEAPLIGLLTAAKANAMIISIESQEKINIFINPKARYLVGSEGADVEIKTAKTSYKGKVVRDSEDNFLFVPGVDKNGNVIPVDITTLEPGMVVKILSK